VDSTRTGITQSISNWLNRSDLLNNGFIDEWFDTAHLSCQRLRADWKAQEDTWAETLQANVDTYAIGETALAHLRKPREIYVYNQNTGFPVAFYQLTDITILRQLAMGLLNVTNINQVPPSMDPAVVDPDSLFAAIWRDELKIFPKPTTTSQYINLQIRFDFYKWLTPPASNNFDWFTTWCRDYIIYRALEESAPFLINDVRLAVWTAKRQQAEREVIGFSTDAEIGGQSLVMLG